MSNLSMEEILKLPWGARNEEDTKRIRGVRRLKTMCMRRVEDLLVQRYHDVDIDDLPKLIVACTDKKNLNEDGFINWNSVLEECNGTKDIDFFIDNIIYDLVKPEHI